MSSPTPSPANSSARSIRGRLGFLMRRTPSELYFTRPISPSNSDTGSTNTVDHMLQQIVPDLPQLSPRVISDTPESMSRATSEAQHTEEAEQTIPEGHLDQQRKKKKKPILGVDPEGNSVSPPVRYPHAPMACVKSSPYSNEGVIHANSPSESFIILVKFPF